MILCSLLAIVFGTIAVCALVLQNSPILLVGALLAVLTMMTSHDVALLLVRS